MSKKRRMFDIEMPDLDTNAEAAPADKTAVVSEYSGSNADDGPAAVQGETFPAGKVDEKTPAPRTRRGPMATAIADAATHTAERAKIEAEIRAENDALAHEHVRMKKLGLVISEVPLDAVETYKLVRDRIKGPDYELGELKSSIAELGLSNPIRLEARADGQYELIQGYRRLAAFKALLDETGDADRFGKIPAVVSDPGDTIDDLYRKMVDENLVRKDISFAEMAQLALDYAADPSTSENDPDKAVARLFKSANYSKRSYVRSFIRVMERVGGVLQFPAAMPRALGLALAARMEDDPHIVTTIKDALAGYDNRSEQGEMNILRQVLQVPADDGLTPETAPKRASKKPTQAKTSFQFNSAAGRAKCTAAAGRLEIRLDRDFSTLDRRKLEAALRLMLDQLD